MRPVVRRLVLVLAAVLALIVIVLAALPYVVSLGATRARILAAAESALHRKVEAGAIRLQILTGLGVGLDDVTVHNGDGWESPALLSAKRVSVKVAFWPLLSRRVVVRRVALDRPVIAVERAPSGALNVDDLLAPAPAGAQPEGAGAPPAAAALLVSRLEISEGAASFVDRKVAPGKTIVTALEDLHGSLSDVGAATAARFDLAGRFLAAGGDNLSLRGTFGPPRPGGAIADAPLSAEFAARGLELARLAPYTGTASDPGVLTIEGKADGAAPGVLHVAGTVGLAPHGAAPSIPPVDGRFDLTFDRANGTLAIAKSPLSVAKLPLSLEGRIEGLHGPALMHTSLRLRTEGDVPIDAVTGVAGAGALPADLRLSGKLRLDAAVEGPSGALVTRGTLDAAPLGVAKAGQPLFAAPAAHATLSAASGAPLSGRVTAPSGTLQTLPFEELVADWTWKDGALTLAPRLKAIGGTIAFRVEANLRAAQSPAHVALDVAGVDAARLVDSLTSVKNVLSGSLTARMDVRSRGLSWDAVSKTGAGEGRLTMADAELKTVQLMPKVADTLGAVGRVAGFQVPPGLESTKFSRLETSLRLADGRLATPDLTMSGRDASVTASGSVGLDRTLAYQGSITLAPSLVKTLGSAGRYVADDQGRLTLPFRVSGSVSAPVVAIDQSIVPELGRRALAHEAREHVGGSAGQALGGILDLLQSRPTPTPTPKPRP